MRKVTQATFGIIGLGVLGLSYAQGANAQVGNTFAAAPATTGTASGSNPAATTSASQSATPSAVATPSASATSSTSSSAGNTATKGSTSGSTASSQPVASASASPSASASAPASTGGGTTTTAAVTKTGTSIPYRFGTVQVSVTKENGKITAINLLQATATHGREQAFSYLVNYAIQAQGTGFANISGATYTTDAFKQSLSSALGKF